MLKRDPYQEIFEQTSTVPKKKLTRNLDQKIFEDKNLPKYVWRKILYQPRRDALYQANLTSSKQIPRETSAKESLRKSYQSISAKAIFDEKSLPRKKKIKNPTPCSGISLVAQNFSELR